MHSEERAVKVIRDGRGRRTFVAVRAFGWQLDYAADGWLPLSVREGRSDWRVLRLGRLGVITLAPLVGIQP